MSSSDIQIFPDPAIDVDSPSEQEFRTFYQENIAPVRRPQNKSGLCIFLLQPDRHVWEEFPLLP